MSRTLALATFAALALSSVVSLAQSTLDSIPQAMAILAKDPAAAATILEAVTTREPGNARAWRLLGTARQQAKQLDAALAAYTKAIALGPDPTSTYNVAVVHALKGSTDAAFEWLARARTARADMSVIAVDANLKALRNDPRFARLLPSPEDFRDPFVEPTKVIHEWTGEAANDQFGWIARAIGDVDGDAISDVVVSAPTHATGGAAAGRLYVYSARSGRLLWKADGSAGHRLGNNVEAAGDLNKDGTPDVVASGGGIVFVYSGRDGAVLRTFKSPGEWPLRATAGAGDVNRDGYADIIAGTAPPSTNATGAAATASKPLPGAAYVFSGKDGSVLLTLTGERDGDSFGSAVAADTHGQRTLLIVGAATAGSSRTGRVYVYTALGARPAFVIDSDATGAALGAMFVAAAGDVNGDGVTDAYASDFPNQAKGPMTGRIYVHSGKDGSRLLTLTGETAGEGFGTSPSAAGDLDGDGHADLAVGAWQYAGAAVSGGRIYIHSGRDGRLLRTITCRIPGDTLGFDSVGIGDIDADGTGDLLVTSGYSGVNGYHSGRVFIVSSGVARSR